MPATLLRSRPSPHIQRASLRKNAELDLKTTKTSAKSTNKGSYHTSNVAWREQSEMGLLASPYSLVYQMPSNLKTSLQQALEDPAPFSRPAAQSGQGSHTPTPHWLPQDKDPRATKQDYFHSACSPCAHPACLPSGIPLQLPSRAPASRYLP